MPGRRSVLAGLFAVGVHPKATWAEAGHPAFLSAGRAPDGHYVLCGLAATGEILFQIPLPGRGHAAAAHPDRAEAVAFARRPGTFALVLDCVSGETIARLDAPSGRHFYGHGTYSADGAWLFTTENDYDAARGVIGIWDTVRGYTRIGEISSGGVGPHDLCLLANGTRLAVANGGIETHPDTGRTKLNIPTMHPNLTLMDLSGSIEDVITPPPELHKTSIRHLALSSDGTLGFAAQWQGDVTDRVPLLGLRSPNGAVRWLSTETDMQGYAGSIAFSGDGQRVAITSPRAGMCQIFDCKSSTLQNEIHLQDICGVAGQGPSFVSTTGQGIIATANGRTVSTQIAWDNHLVVL